MRNQLYDFFPRSCKKILSQHFCVIFLNSTIIQNCICFLRRRDLLQIEIAIEPFCCHLPLTSFECTARSRSSFMLTKSRCNSSFLLFRLSKDALYSSSRLNIQQSIFFILSFNIFDCSRSDSKTFCCSSLKAFSATSFCRAYKRFAKLRTQNHEFNEICSCVCTYIHILC